MANDEEPLAQFLQVTWFAAIAMEILDGVLLDAYCREDCGAVWEHGKKTNSRKIFQSLSNLVCNSELSKLS